MQADGIPTVNGIRAGGAPAENRFRKNRSVGCFANILRRYLTRLREIFEPPVIGRA